LLALDWILHKDEMQLGPTDLNLYQHYVLSLLAFQFDSLAWASCGGNYSDFETICTVQMNGTDSEQDDYKRWLSGTDECDWYGVSCLDGKIRELALHESIFHYLTYIRFSYN
jgi:hypothetical protein